MNYSTLLKNIEDYVTGYFESHPNPLLFYHNILHTKSVSKSAIQIACHYQLDDRSVFILCAAAWFHDVGYIVDTIEHERTGAEMAEKFLTNKGVDTSIIQEIKRCILATKMPQSPVTLLEKIICDADLFYLGTDKFKKISRRFIKETEAMNRISYTGSEARAIVIKFLRLHHYHTDYCINLLEAKKAQNLADMERRQEEKNNIDFNGEPVEQRGENKLKKNKAKKPANSSNQVRGVQTMFRVSTTNSVRVSVMADNKAHIMISVNSIIISIVLAFLVRNVEAYMHFLIPTLMLVTVNLVTITYSVLATRPRVADGRFTDKQVEDKSVNLLFFGSFYKMEYPDYQVAVNKMMKDPEFLYGNLTKDVFWQGRVLGRKYRLLRTAYNIFMYGMIATVIAFLLAAVFFS